MPQFDQERKAIEREFSDRVNLPPKELEDWLATEESKSVADAGGEGEST